MLRVLICSEDDLRAELRPTLIGRAGVDLFQSKSLEELRVLASALSPQVILIDRDLDDARQIVEALREDKATRNRSLAILARGDLRPSEVELLEAGANGILRLPPGPDWDERLSKLLQVQTRQEARIPVHFALEGGDSVTGVARNVSAGGMLLASGPPLELHQEIAFRFKLPDGTDVSGRGRVVREAVPGEYGVEFLPLDDESRAAIRGFVRSARLG